MQPITYRPWAQRTVLALVLAVFLVVGIAMLFVDDPIGKRDWGSVVIGGLLILFSVPGI